MSFKLALISLALTACVSSIHAQAAAWPATSYSPYFQELFRQAGSPVAAEPSGPGLQAPAIPIPAPVPVPVAQPVPMPYAAPVFAAPPPPPMFAAPPPVMRVGPAVPAFAGVATPAFAGVATPAFAGVPMPAFAAPAFAAPPPRFVPAFAPFVRSARYYGASKAKTQ